MFDTSVAEDVISTHYEKFYKNNELNSASFIILILMKDASKLETRFMIFRVCSWINENPDDTSIEIGKRLEAFSNKNSNCEFSSLGLKELKDLGMNLLLAVGQGSELFHLDVI